MMVRSRGRARGLGRGGATAGVLALASLWAMGCGGTSVRHTGSDPGGESGSSGATAGSKPDIDACETAADCVLALPLRECCSCPVAISRKHYEEDRCYLIEEESRDIPDECAVPCPLLPCEPCLEQGVSCVGRRCVAGVAEAGVPDAGTEVDVGYHCRGTDQRIERDRVCDRVNDCPEGDDEPCFKTPPACPRQAPIVEAWFGGASICGIKGIGDADYDFSYVLVCASGDQIQPSRQCDSIADCPDGDDEDGCPIICEPTCDPDGCTYPPCEMPCADGSTVLVSDVCNSVRNCPGGEDERCVDRYACPFDLGSSIDFSQVCDGIEDCEGGYDELYCPHPAPSDYFICDDGEEILFPYFSGGCRGPWSPHEPHCADGSAPYFPCPPDR